MIAFFAALLRFVLQAFRSKGNIPWENALATTVNVGDHTAEIGFENKFNQTNNGWWGHSIEMDAPDRYIEDIWQLRRPL